MHGIGTNRISRNATPVRIRGIAAATWSEAARRLATRRIYVSDLTLGAWKSHQAAGELLGQMGVHAPPIRRSSMAMPFLEGTPDAYADTVGVFVDAEGAGNLTAIHALKFANAVLNALDDSLPATLAIIPPGEGFQWEPENEWFVQFLARGLAGTTHELVLLRVHQFEPVPPPLCAVEWDSANKPTGGSLQVESSIDSIPGVFRSEDLPAASRGEIEAAGCVPLPNGYYLVPPERRPLAPAVRAASGWRSWEGADWIRSAFAVWNEGERPDARFLYQTAWARFAEGGHGIALRLLEKAIRHAETLMEYAYGEMQAQCMRIARGNHAAAAAVPPPPPELPEWIRGFLHQGIGWGCAMTNRPAEAEPHLAKSLAYLIEKKPSREYLYLMNIAALNRFRLGRVDEAFDLEREIEAVLTDREEDDWHLRYLNSVNLARLHRETGDFGRAADYFERAFECTAGLRSESDSIYMNALWARLEEKRGGAAAAFRAWFRAALHWAAAEAPEALGVRVIRALAGNAADREIPMPETVSRALRVKLAEAGERAGIAVPQLNPAVSHAFPQSVPAFVRVDGLEENHALPAFETALGGDGWGVLVSPRPAIPAYRGPEFDRLQAELLSVMISENPDANLDAAKTIGVHARFGREMPATEFELLELAHRCGIASAWRRNREYDIDGLRQRVTFGEFKVKFSDALDTVRFHPGGASLSFKRYLPVLELGAREVGLLRRVKDSPCAADLAAAPGRDMEELMTSLRDLERRRALILEAPPDLAVAGGTDPAGKSG